MPPAAPLALNGALPSPTRSHYQPKSVQRAEKRLGVTTEYADLSLHSASANGNLGLVKYALLNGQPVNSVLNGVLPLHAAASSGNEAIVRMLLEHGADVNSPRLPRRYSNDRTRSSGIAVGTSGSTPLHFAAANNHSQIVSILLSHGAKVSATEKYGLTPEALAIQKGHIDIAELLRAWADDEADAASSASGGNSLRSRSKKRIHPQRSFDTLALKLSQHTSSSHLPPIFATSSSSSSLNIGNQTPSPVLSFASSRRGSMSSQLTDTPSHRRPSLPSVFERAAHPAASLKAALGRRRHGSGSRPGTAEEETTEDGGRRRSEDLKWLGRKGSIGGASLDERPTTAPHGKTSFYPAEIASSGSTTTSMPTGNSSTSSLATPVASNHAPINTSLANTFYRPRQSSQLSGGSRGGSASARSPSNAPVFVDDDEDEIENGEEDEDEAQEDRSQVPTSPRSTLLPSPLGLVHARESSAASSLSYSSSQLSPTRLSTPDGTGTSADNSDEGSRERKATEAEMARASTTLVEPRRTTIVRERTNSIGSTSSSFSRGPSSLAASSSLRHSHSNDLMPVDRRSETRTSRSNSAGTDGRFSSSPASSYLSTYAPSNSTAPTSVGPSSLPSQQHAARQPFLSPLYESGPFVAKAQDPGSPPITTSAQARSRVKKAEQELRAYSTSASSSTSSTRLTLSQQLAAYGQSVALERKLVAQETQLALAYHYETIGKGGSRSATIGERRAESKASSITLTATPLLKSLLRAVVEPTKTPHWRAIPTEDRLMPPPTIHHRSASPASNPGHHKKHEERAKDVPKSTPTLPSISTLPRASNPPTRASSPSSTSSSLVLGGSNGVSYVEVSSPTSAARSLRPPRSSGAGGKSDRTHSQKGGSVTSSKDQVLLDAAEQARIAAAIPQAQITTGATKQAKKGFARRLFSSVKL